MYLRFFMISALMPNLSSYSSIDSCISLRLIHIYTYKNQVHIIYQTMLQAKIMDNFHEDNNLLPIHIVAILP